MGKIIDNVTITYENGKRVLYIPMNMTGIKLKEWYVKNKTHESKLKNLYL